LPRQAAGGGRPKSQIVISDCEAEMMAEVLGDGTDKD
jgi:hypothetical protein